MSKSLRFSLSVALLMAGLASTACSKDKSPSDSPINIPNISSEGTYALDTTESKIEWKGFKILKSKNTSHFGTIHFSSGTLNVRDQQLRGGEFTANMYSLENIDLVNHLEQKIKLENYLKTKDFFDVEKFPKASYIITKVEYTKQESDYNSILHGNLTIKGVSQPVKFKANISIEEHEIRVATEPTDLMREDFGLNFETHVQNGIIKNEFNIQAFIKAVRKER